MLLLLEGDEPAAGRWRHPVDAESGEASAVFAEWGGNPLRDPLPPPSSWPAPMAIVRSGSLAEATFAEEPRNWMGPGRRALEQCCDALVGPLAEAGRTLLWRPHARQVLSDLAGTAEFLRRHRGERFGLALAPADLLTAAMLDAAEELLPRAVAVLAPHASLLILEDLASEGDGVARVPLGEGRLPLGPLRAAIAALPTVPPLAIRASQWRRQLERLGLPARG